MNRNSVKLQLVYFLTVGVFYWIVWVYHMVSMGEWGLVNFWLDEHLSFNLYQAFMFMFLIGLLWSVTALICFVYLQSIDKFYLLLQSIMILAWFVLIILHTIILNSWVLSLLLINDKLSH